MKKSVKKRRDVIRLFAKVAGDIMPEVFASPDYCINGTWICCEVLRRFGIEARPVSVQLTAANKIWLEKLQANGGWPNGKAESDAWAAEGGYALAVGRMSPETELKWNGHLVAAACGLLVDVAAGQFSRPQHKIEIPQVFLSETKPGWLDGKAIFLYGPHGAVLSYKAHPEDETFRECPGFRPSETNLKVARWIEDAMREHLP